MTETPTRKAKAEEVSIPPDVMARALSEAERNRRAQACAAAIDAALKQHGCAIKVEVVLSENGIRPMYFVVAI